MVALMNLVSVKCGQSPVLQYCMQQGQLHELGFRTMWRKSCPAVLHVIRSVTIKRSVTSLAASFSVFNNMFAVTK